MKFLTYLLTFTFALNAIAVAPYGLKGQNSSTIYPNVHQAPNNQITQMAGINALIETGNTNILANPSLEHSTFSTSWTISGCSWVVESTVVIHGKKSGKITCTAQTLSLTQDSTNYQAQYADGVQGLQTARAKTAISGFFMCARAAATTNLNLCVPISSLSKWGLYKIPTILGGTSNGLAIISGTQALPGGPVVAGAVTGDLYVDDTSLGAVDLKVDGGVNSQSSSHVLNSSMAVTSDIHTSGAGLYAVSTVSGKVRFTALATISISGAGFYGVSNSAPIGSEAVWYRNGTYIIDQIQFSSAGGSQQSRASASFQTTLQPNDYIEFLGQSYSAGTFQASQVSVVASQTSLGAYTAQNADTDWASCGHVAGDFTNWGAVSAIETECKRQGSDLLMRGSVTSGTTPVATEARMNLKFNGGAVTAKTASSIQAAGMLVAGTTGTSSWTVLIESAVNYATFGQQNLSMAGLTKQTGTVEFAASTKYSFEGVRIPINGWQGSNSVIGSFNEVATAPGISKPKSCTYTWGGAGSLTSRTNCTSTPCIEYYDSCNAGTNVWNSTGAVSITFQNGTFAASTAISCYQTLANGANGIIPTMAAEVATTTLGGYAFQSGSYIAGSTTNTNTTGTITCFGTAP